MKMTQLNFRIVFERKSTNSRIEYLRSNHTYSRDAVVNLLSKELGKAWTLVSVDVF